jgi:hypothetical protein
VQIVSSGDDSGEVPWWNGQAFYQGMKLALFDVTDLANPVQTASVSIGDRGTDSPALNDPHAILFDPSRNLLAFPVSVAQLSNPDPTRPWLGGDRVFQGAYVFNVSPDNGFSFHGSITHKPGSVNATWGDEIDRVLMIGSDLYTLSDAALKANDADSLDERASVPLPQLPGWPYFTIYPDTVPINSSGTNFSGTSSAAMSRLILARFPRRQ